MRLIRTPLSCMRPKVIAEWSLDDTFVAVTTIGGQRAVRLTVGENEKHQFQVAMTVEEWCRHRDRIDRMLDRHARKSGGQQ